MKSFQPKAEATPPDDEGPGDPPAPDTTLEPTPETAPSETPAETDPMPRNSRRHRNAEVDFKGEKRANGCHWNAIGPSDNGNHASTTDPDARLYKKSPGTGAVLCFMGHALMENRHGFVVQGDLTQADGHAERRAALDMVHRHSPGSTRRLTLGADKGYDAAGFVADLRQAWFRAETIPRIVSCRPSPPHVARKSRYSAIDGRTTRHAGYALSLKHRKKIDLRRENDPPDRFLILLTFGWAKTVGGMAQTMYRGVERVRSRFILTMAANNLARPPRLLGA